MERNKKWFALLMLLLFMSMFMVIVLWLMTFSHNVSNENYIAHKKVQASNYAVEWIEMVKGYVSTEINKDRINGWKEKVLPLSWNYRVSFDEGYEIHSQESEIIEVDEPYVVDYERSIQIVTWDYGDEKKITVVVDYGENTKVSYETTLVNLYWE